MFDISLNQITKAHIGVFDNGLHESSMKQWDYLCKHILITSYSQIILIFKMSFNGKPHTDEDNYLTSVKSTGSLQLALTSISLILPVVWSKPAMGNFNREMDCMIHGLSLDRLHCQKNSYVEDTSTIFTA